MECEISYLKFEGSHENHDFADNFLHDRTEKYLVCMRLLMYSVSGWSGEMLGAIGLTTCAFVSFVIQSFISSLALSPLDLRWIFEFFAGFWFYFEVSSAALMYVLESFFVISKCLILCGGHRFALLFSFATFAAISFFRSSRWQHNHLLTSASIIRGWGKSLLKPSDILSDEIFEFPF